MDRGKPEKSEKDTGRPVNGGRGILGCRSHKTKNASRACEAMRGEAFFGPEGVNVPVVIKIFLSALAAFVRTKGMILSAYGWRLEKRVASPYLLPGRGR